MMQDVCKTPWSDAKHRQTDRPTDTDTHTHCQTDTHCQTIFLVHMLRSKLVPYNKSVSHTMQIAWEMLIKPTGLMLNFISFHCNATMTGEI